MKFCRLKAQEQSTQFLFKAEVINILMPCWVSFLQEKKMAICVALFVALFLHLSVDLADALGLMLVFSDFFLLFSSFCLDTFSFSDPTLPSLSLE
jgi:hypothetical protein